MPKANNNRLSTIAQRHSTSRLRDAFFAACVALAASVSFVAVSTASHVASAQPAPEHVSR